MRAIILAAGRGSRMGPMTWDRPKCLLELEGRSLLARQLAAFRRASVTEVAVVTGWRAEQFSGTRLRRFHNSLWATTTMVDSLACAEEWLLAGPAVVCYGDIVFTPEAVEALVMTPHPVTITYDRAWLSLWSRRFPDPLSDAECFRLDPEGLVTELGGPPQSLDAIEGQYTGLFRIEPDGWQALRAEAESSRGSTACRDMTALLGELVRRCPGSVRAIPVQGPWHEFDTEHDVEVGRPLLARLDRRLFACVQEREARETTARFTSQEGSRE